MAKITILGRVASKKNSKRIFINQRTGKPIVKSSEAYENFEQMALWQLKSCRERFDCPVRVKYVFELQGRQDIDADNAMASINDVLQLSGVLVNDKSIVAGSFEKIAGCADHKTMLEIEEV